MTLGHQADLFAGSHDLFCVNCNNGSNSPFCHVMEARFLAVTISPAKLDLDIFVCTEESFSDKLGRKFPMALLM